MSVIISSTALKDAPSIIGQTRKADQDSSLDGKDTQHVSYEPQKTNVQISEAARRALAKDNIEQPLKDFLATKGRQTFENSIKDIAVYPQNLATIVEDKSTSTEAATAAQNALAKRELESFGKFAKQSPPDFKMFYKSYVEYIDSLSPEEQNSSRYRGLRSEAVSMYEYYSRKDGEEPDDLSFSRNPILRLFELMQNTDMKTENLESIRDRYTEEFGLNQSFTSNTDLQETARIGLERFDAFSLALKEASEGNLVALDQLNRLFSDPNSIKSFIEYTKKLTPLQNE